MKTFRTLILIAGILIAGLAINTAFAQDAPVDKEIPKTDKETAKANKESLKAELKHKPHPKEKPKIHKHRIKAERKHYVKSGLDSKKPVHKRKEKLEFKN